MSQHHKRMSGTARQRRNARILGVSDVCHICGHAGSDSIDHVLPLAPVKDDPSEMKRRDEDESNLRPAHHDVACPTCGEQCNRSKGAKPWAPILRHSTSLARP